MQGSLYHSPGKDIVRDRSNVVLVPEGQTQREHQSRLS